MGIAAFAREVEVEGEGEEEEATAGAFDALAEDVD